MSDKTSLSLLPELEKDLQGIPRSGLFPSQYIWEMIKNGQIIPEIEIADGQVQPASLDLRVGSKAYRTQASFLPGKGCAVEQKLKDLKMATLDLDAGALFERHCVYVVKLMERLKLPENVSAKANPKSTTGRLDVFTRLIVDGATEFDTIPAGYDGPLYAEIFPGTFSIAIQAGKALNQIRFVKGNPESTDKDLSRLDLSEQLIYFKDDVPGTADIQSGLRLSVRLNSDDGKGIIGYKARRNAPVIDLSKINHYEIPDFWEPVYDRGRNSLVLNPGDFYILASKEKVRVPPDYAAEMVPFDPSIGEFRIHYAGFFDPGFGYGASATDIMGTYAVLELRAHEVPFLIEDEQTIGRLVYAKLLEPPKKTYGQGIGSSYQNQGLALSKQFKRTP